MVCSGEITRHGDEKPAVESRHLTMDPVIQPSRIQEWKLGIEIIQEESVENCDVLLV